MVSVARWRLFARNRFLSELADNAQIEKHSLRHAVCGNFCEWRNSEWSRRLGSVQETKMNEGTSTERQLVPPEVAFKAFKAYVHQFDPIELLSQLTMTFLFTQEGFQGEATDTRRWARWIEFTAGYLVTVPSRSEPYQTFDGSHIEEFERLILQYFDSFLYEAVNRPPDARESTPSDRVLQHAKLYSLWVRGDAYPHLFFEYARELYGQHNGWFRSNLGFTIQEAIQIFRVVTDELNRRFNESADYARENMSGESDKYWEDAKAAGLSRKDLEIRVACQLHFGNGPALLRFTVEQIAQLSDLPIDVCRAFLKRLSQPFGYRNSKFAETFSDPLKGPWDYNTMEERPFIERDGFYWLFTTPMVPSVLFHTFFFDLMNDRAYAPSFEKTRCDLVEQKVWEYMKRIFPAHMVLRNPAYPNGDEFSDVAVLHDGKILIFQCKAKGLTRDARIGADFSALRTDMQKAIRLAFDQAVRARQYIRSTDAPTLKAGNMALRIDGSMITDIYLINVTLMPFLTFATRFENIEEALGLFPEREYPFSTALGDLDIITQILNSPAAFLHYIHRRLALEKTTFAVDADEIDLLGYYLSQGMYFDVADFAETTNLWLNGFSDEIDEYVYRKYDEHGDVQPPTAPVPAGFSELIAGIESLSNMYRTDVALALLDMGGAGRQKMVELIEKTKAASRLDGKGHSFSMGLTAGQTRGFSFVSAVGEKTDEAIFDQAMGFAHLKKYAEKCEEWFGLGWHKDSDRVADIAVVLKGPWVKDEEMEGLAARLLKPGLRIDFRNEGDG